MRRTPLLQIVMLILFAGPVVLLAGCPWPWFSSRPTVETFVPRLTVRVGHGGLSIPEALELAHRQCGLEWAAIAGAIDPAAAAPVGPFELDEDVPLSDLLDKVAHAAGADWQWKHGKAVFGKDEAEAVRVARHKLKSKSADQRAEGVNDLARLACPSAVAPLAAACRDADSPAVRRAAFAALATMEADAMRYQPVGRIPVLAAILDEPPDLALPVDGPGGPDWQNAVIVLGAARVTDAEAVILLTMGHAHERGLAAAAWALGQLGGGESAGRLAGLLGDAHQPESVRWQAGLALARTGGGVDLLVLASESGEPTTALLATESLGWSQADAAIPRLERLASGGSAEIALAAADALGRIGSESANGGALTRLLDSKLPAVRRRAADALGQTGSPICRELLIGAMGGADAPLAAVIADALGRLGGESAGAALHELAAAANHHPMAVRLAALTALARISANRWPDPLDRLEARKAGVDEKLAVVIGLGLSREGSGSREVGRMVEAGAGDDGGELDVVRQAGLALIRMGKDRVGASRAAASQAEVSASAPDATQPVSQVDPTVVAHGRPDGTVLLSWPVAAIPDLAGYLVFRIDDFGNGPMLRVQAWPVIGNAWIDRVVDPRLAGRRYLVAPVDSRGRQGRPAESAAVEFPGANRAFRGEVLGVEGGVGGLFASAATAFSRSA